MKKGENTRMNEVLDYVLIVLGSCIFASGLVIFVKPAMISMGGIAGIALIGNYVLGLPLGVASIVLNIPLFMADQTDRLIGLVMEKQLR